jgi:hypothetical protein
LIEWWWRARVDSDRPARHKSALVDAQRLVGIATLGAVCSSSDPARRIMTPERQACQRLFSAE